MPLNSPRFTRSPRLQKAADNNPPVGTGETSEAVRIIQMALVDLGFPMPITTNAGQKLPDGIFGSETARTVRAFQAANGLSADGVVGRDTMNRLESLTIASTTVQAKTDSFQTRHRMAFA